MVANEDDDDDAGSTSSNSRAQYVSANCVVFTHYSGDVAAVVDEHFTRALNYASDLKNNVANTKGKLNESSHLRFLYVSKKEIVFIARSRASRCGND